MKTRWLLAAPVVIGAAAYLAARAMAVPLTYDEASSFHRYVDGEVVAIFDFASATNHFLNSLLKRVTTVLFGTAPSVLRLPSVLAGVAYLVVAAAFARRARHAAIGLAGLVLLAANPYVLDYLTLARGYGLAIALLTGAVFVLLRWREHRRSRDLALGLCFAGVAVAANFAMLTAFLACLATVIAWTLWAPTQDPGPKTQDPRPRTLPLRSLIVWLIVTASFTAAVFSRERALSPDAYLPVTVRIVGLFEDELAQVQVFRADSTGRLRELSRQPGGLWRSGPVHDAWQMRVVLPAAADRNLASLELTMGAQVYRRDRRTPGPWLVEDSNEDRVLVSTHDVVWRGDRAHVRLVALHTAATLGVLVLLAVFLVMLSRAVVARRWLAADQAHVMGGAVMWVASLVAAPLYLLQRDEQLFFGGATGLYADTFLSLVRGTTYGVERVPGQAMMAAIALAVAVAGLTTLMLASARLRRMARFQDAAFVLAVIAVVAVQATVQHHLLGTPYPFARTAVYLLPLLMLFALLLSDAVAELGRVARVVMTAVMVALAAAGAVNFARSANLTHTLDWTHDATTDEMLEIIEGSYAAGQAPAVVRVGVEWMFYPVARYYAERRSTGVTHYDMIVLPGDGRPFDFVYGDATPEARTGEEMRRFPLSGATLWRGRP